MASRIWVPGAKICCASLEVTTKIRISPRRRWSMRRMRPEEKTTSPLSSYQEVTSPPPTIGSAPRAAWGTVKDSGGCDARSLHSAMIGATSHRRADSPGAGNFRRTATTGTGNTNLDANHSRDHTCRRTFILVPRPHARPRSPSRIKHSSGRQDQAVSVHHLGPRSSQRWRQHRCRSWVFYLGENVLLKSGVALTSAKLPHEAQILSSGTAL